MFEGKSLQEIARALWHVQRVKRLIRDRLGIVGMQSLVSVREAICTDPGCEGLATEIRIVMLGVREIRGAIHKEVFEVSDSDIEGFLDDVAVI